MIHMYDTYLWYYLIESAEINDMQGRVSQRCGFFPTAFQVWKFCWVPKKSKLFPIRHRNLVDFQQSLQKFGNLWGIYHTNPGFLGEPWNLHIRTSQPARRAVKQLPHHTAAPRHLPGTKPEAMLWKPWPMIYLPLWLCQNSYWKWP